MNRKKPMNWPTLAAGFPGRAMVQVGSANLLTTMPIKAATAAPPTQLCTAHHPQATIVLEIAGTCAPTDPKVNLAKPGKGIPYLVPMCEFNCIGIRTMKFPKATFRTDSQGLIPKPIRADVRVNDGRQIAIPTHNIVML